MIHLGCMVYCCIPVRKRRSASRHDGCLQFFGVLVLVMGLWDLYFCYGIDLEAISRASHSFEPLLTVHTGDLQSLRHVSYTSMNKRSNHLLRESSINSAVLSLSSEVLRRDGHRLCWSALLEWAYPWRAARWYVCMKFGLTLDRALAFLARKLGCKPPSLPRAASHHHSLFTSALDFITNTVTFPSQSTLSTKVMQCLPSYLYV